MTSGIPNFHDGRLTGVRLGDDLAVLDLQRADGTAHVLTLTGLVALHVEDLRQGNLIVRLALLSGAPLGPDAVALARLLPPPHPSAAGWHHEAHARLIGRQADAVAAGAATLVVIAPSYGADVVALCARATVMALP